MKLVIILCALFIFGITGISIPYEQPASQEDLCDNLRWGAAARDSCVLAKLDARFPGARANWSACDPKTTLLHVAAEHGDAHSVKTLLALGAGADLSAVNAHGRTPLFLALRRPDAALVALLLFAGAEVNLADGARDTPLHVAVATHVRAERSGAEELRFVRRHVSKLLLAGADADARNAQGFTPVDLARRFNSSIVDMLLGKEAISGYEEISDVCSAYIRANWEYLETDTKETKKRYVNGLDWCGRREIRYDWILSEEDIDKKDIYSQTVLHRAATGAVKFWSNYKKIVDAAKDKNVQDWLGLTPLHVAIMCDARPVIGYLKEGGANAEIKDNLRRIPEDMRSDTVFRPLSTLHKY